MSKEANDQVAFISQEAREKAREIQVKADEEFAIEKVCHIAPSGLTLVMLGRDGRE
jgi:V-type H+-transporting ATPase subunit E